MAHADGHSGVSLLGMSGDDMPVPHAFASVIFLLQPSESDGESSYLERGAKWLDRWLPWFLERNGVTSGRNLHLLYDRSVSTLGPGALALHGEISRLAAVAHEHGTTFASELYLVDCLTRPEVYERLLQEDVLNSVILNPENCSVADNEEAILMAVEAAARHGVAVILLGSPGFWSAVGVLESDIVNSCNFRIVPGKSEMAGLVDLAGKESRPALRSHEVSTTTASPCDTRFAAYVTPGGDIYPCLGLVGCEQWCLGSIDSIPEESRFATGEILNELTRWGRSGPNLGDSPSSFSDHIFHLPSVCAMHRQLVERDSDANQSP